MTCRLGADSTLFLLPDPVTCFGEADYKQCQSFRLHQSSNLVLLDWFTSGRQSRGESWSFHRYGSINEIFVGEKRIALDILSLRDSDTVSIPRRLRPYFLLCNCLFVRSWSRRCCIRFDGDVNEHAADAARTTGCAPLVSQ